MLWFIRCTRGLLRVGAPCLLLVFAAAPACHKKLPAELTIPRAPVEPAPVPVAPPPAPIESPPVQQTPAPPADGPTSEAPADVESAVSQSPPAPKTPAASAPKAPAPKANPEDHPVVKASADKRPAEAGSDQPSTPRLLPDADAAGAASKEVGKTLARADTLLNVLRARNLTQAQRREQDAGATFVNQAREALTAGDAARAAVLADKSMALLESLELATRP